MTRDADGADAVIAALMMPPVVPTAIAVHAPHESGLYAWWPHPSVLPAMPGQAHPDDAGLRLLNVGLATRGHPRRPGAAQARGTSRAALDEYRRQPRGALPTGRRVVALLKVVEMARAMTPDRPLIESAIDRTRCRRR